MGQTGLAGQDGKGNRPSRLIKLTVDPLTMIANPASLEVLVGKNSTWALTSRPDGNSTGDVSILPSGIANGTTIVVPTNLIADPDLANLGHDYQLNDTDFQNNNNLEDYLATDSESHTIGAVHFGPDGKLYLSNGDGTSYNFRDPRAIRVQDIDNLSGKILRIDPITGKGLPDNPFFNGNPNTNRSKVFYFGTRNPYRFSFDSATGYPVIGDVGWNSWEEINTGVPGSNFGWPYFEGPNRAGSYQTLPQAVSFYSNGNRNNSDEKPAIFPLLNRRHGAPDFATAIVLGDFYNSNTLIFGDINNGTIFAVTLDTNRAVENIQVFDVDIPRVVDMEMGPDGKLYGVDISGLILRWDLV